MVAGVGPSEAPSVLRCGGRSAQPACRVRRGPPRRGAGALARPHGLALVRRRPSRSDALRQRPAARPRPRVIAKLFLPLVLFSLALPAVAGWLLIGGWYGFFAGLFWGGAVRIFLLQHVTFSINSICHVWGRRGSRRATSRATCGGSPGSRSVSRGTTTTTRSPPRRSTVSAAGRSIRGLADLAARARRPRLERRPRAARQAGPQARDALKS